MKKIILCLSFLCSITINVHAQWKQSLSGQSGLIDNISVVNDNVVWVKDQTCDSVSITINGGIDWVTKKLTPEMIAGGTGGLCAVSSTTAFIIVSQTANKGVYKTTNSGDTWTRQTTAFNNSSSFPDLVYFWNELDGIAIGDVLSDGYFEVYTTTNGGEQWNKNTSSSLLSVSGDGTFNSNNSFRVHGSTFYFFTIKGKILKSTDKGLTWTTINTPLKSSNYVSFDFQDNSNGMIAYYYSKYISIVYYTNDGGLTWTWGEEISGCFPNVVYNITKGIYLSSSSSGGLTYSNDNGKTWIGQSSFYNVGIKAIGISPTGKMFIGGWKYVYSTENYEGLNVSLTDAFITSPHTIDLSFDGAIIDSLCAQDTSNYKIGYIENKIFKRIKIQSISQVSLKSIDFNENLVQIHFESVLPLDTINLEIKDIFEKNGSKEFPILIDPNKKTVLHNIVKTIELSGAGTLSSFLSQNELDNVNNLTIKGNIDKRDFSTLSMMNKLTVLDLSETNIKEHINEANVVYAANKVPDYTFDDQLRFIKLPPSTAYIGDGAFNGCFYLSSINLPSSIVSIGDGAFAYCLSLVDTLTLPSSITTIGEGAFGLCTGLTGFAIDDSNPIFSTLDGVLFNKYKTELIIYPAGKQGDYLIPKSVTALSYTSFESCGGLGNLKIIEPINSIGSGAFWYSSLSSVTIGKSVTYIGPGAFSYCKSLSSIYVDSTIPLDLTDSRNVFYDVDKTTCTLYVPIGSKTLYQAANQWKDFTNIVEFNTTSTKNINKESINIFPNPITDTFQMSGFEGNGKISISDLSGKTLITKQAISNEKISLSKLNKGVYILNLTSKEGTYTKKFVKQ